jgi:hypothetical protein
MLVRRTKKSIRDGKFHNLEMRDERRESSHGDRINIQEGVCSPVLHILWREMHVEAEGSGWDVVATLIKYFPPALYIRNY